MSDSFTEIELQILIELRNNLGYRLLDYRLKPVLQDRAEKRPFILLARDRESPILVAASRLSPERASMVLAANMIQTG